MKAIYIITLVLLCSFSLPQSGSEFIKTYNWDTYSVKTGFCEQQSQIAIQKSNVVIFKNCGGDGVYSRVDTLYINNDKAPDFVFSYILEDYFNIGLLISDDKGGYKHKLLNKEYFSPSTYTLDFALKRDKQEVEFTINDVDNNGYRDIVVNLHFDGQNYKAIKNYTDTLYNNELLQAIQ